MSRRTYSDDFKKNAVKELISSNSITLDSLAEKLEIPWTTLYSWKRSYGKIKDMSTNTNIHNFTSPEQKLELLNKTYSLTENELGLFLRENGLFSHDLDKIRMELLQGMKSRESQSNHIDKHKHEKLKNKLKSLQNEYNKMQTAFTQQSARIILLKKSQEIWGTDLEDEG